MLLSNSRRVARNCRTLGYALLGALVLATTPARAQTTYTWIGIPGSAYSLATNWSPVRISPATNDVLVFDGAITPSITVNGFVSQQIGQLKLQNSAIVAMNWPGPGGITLGIGGGVGDDLVVPAGCQLVVQPNGTLSLTVQLLAGSTGRIDGKIVIFGDAGSVRAFDASSLVFKSGGEARYASNGTPFGGAANLNTVVFEPGSTYVCEQGSGDVFGAPAPASVVTFQPGSTFKVTGGTMPPMNGRTFADVVVNSASLSPAAVTGNSAVTIDSLIVLNGTPHLRLTALHIRGNISISGGGGLTFDPTASQTVFLDGTAAQTVQRSPQFNNNSLLQITNPAGVTFRQGLFNLSTCTLAPSSKLTLQCPTLQNTGSFTVNGTLRLDPGFLSTSGPAYVYGPSSRLEVAQTASLTLTNQPHWPAVSGPPNLSMLGGGSLTFGAGVSRSISGNLTLSNGVLDVSAGSLALLAGATLTGGSSASHVKGLLSRGISASAGSSAYAFPIGDAGGYAPMSIQFPAVSAGGTLGVRTSAGDHVSLSGSGLAPAKTVNRTWSVANAGLIFSPATADFGFPSADVDAGVTPADLVGRKFDSPATWSQLPTGSASLTGISASGITSFSDFQFGESLPGCVAGVSFARTDHPVGNGPWAIGSADLDGNGTADIAVSDYGSNALSVLSGDGAGGFAASVQYPAGLNPVSMAIGDVTGDTKLDLVVTNWSGAEVSIFAGDGAGAFAPRTDIALPGSRPISAVLGRIDANVSLDLFVPRWSDSEASVLLANGAGGFGAGASVAAGDGPYDAALGDLNGDGVLDAVVALRGRLAAGNSIAVMLGDGLGGFAAATFVTVGGLPNAVAIGDVNVDGRPDVVVANFGSNSISILPGDGHGGFGTRIDQGVGLGPIDVAIGDMNGDARADIVVSNSGSNDITVLYADCFGGLGGGPNFDVGAAPRQLVLVDLDQDGDLDVVVANATGNSVSVMRNTTSEPVTSLSFRGVLNTARGGSQLSNAGDVMLTVLGIGSSGNDGVEFASADSSTTRTVEFALGGLDLDPAVDAGGHLQFTIEGSAAGTTTTLAGIRVDVSATGLDVTPDFAGGGATLQTMELFNGSEKVHSCLVAAGTPVHRAAIAGPAKSETTPGATTTAGDGIKQVEVGRIGLRNWPGLLRSAVTFNSVQPTTLGGTTVLANRMQVSAYNPKLPLVMAKSVLTAASPSGASHLAQVQVANQAAMVSDTTGRQAGLTLAPRGAASIWEDGAEDIIIDDFGWGVAGIGSSGQDGVEVDLTNATGGENRFAPGVGFQTARDAGAELRHTLRAALGCAPDSLVGTLTEKAYADSITVHSDFAYLGASQIKIELLSQGSVVHSGLYGVGQGVQLVAPLPGPGFAAQAASINTTRSNIKDKATISTSGKIRPSIELGWVPSPAAYQVAIGAARFSADAVRFEPVDGVSLTFTGNPHVPVLPALTSAGFYLKNPGVAALDSLKFLRPGLVIGTGGYSVTALRNTAVMSADGRSAVASSSYLLGTMQDGVLRVSPPAPKPALSVAVTGVTATAATPPTATLTAAVIGKTSTGSAVTSPAIAIARNIGGFSIGPLLAGPIPAALTSYSPSATMVTSYRLRVFSGNSTTLDVTQAAPEVTVANFPDRLAGTALEQGFEVVWATLQSIALTGGGAVAGDRVRITPVAPAEVFSSLTAMRIAATDVPHLEISDPLEVVVAASDAGVAPSGVSLGIVGNPARVSSGVTFAIGVPAVEDARLELFDVAGRRIVTLHAGALQAGITRMSWNPRAATTAGLLMARLITPHGTRTQKFVLIR